MALLFMDGFDHLGTSASIGPGKWGSNPGNFPNTSTSQIRTGTHSARITGSTYSVVTRPYVTSGGAVIGVAWYGDAPLSITSSPRLFQVLEGAIVHMEVSIDALGHLLVKRGTTVIATGTTVLTMGSWYYIEFKTVINDTTGTYEVHIDGVQEVALTGTGDTRNGGTGVWDRVLLGPLSNNPTYCDDFYLCDMNVAVTPNNFLGPIKIETLYPQTDAVAAGSNAGLTPSTGSDHGAMVDETTPNITDYNSSITVDAKDTYNYPPMTLSGTIAGIQTNLYAAKSDASPRSVCPVVRAGGADYDGATILAPTTFDYLCQTWATNPATSVAWTTADIAAIQVGMKVKA